MSKYRSPTEEEKRILRRNGVDPEDCAVSFAGDGVIYILRFKTRDEISVRQGCRGWDTYKD